PKQYSAYVSLSELYQRMGLDAEAISALQTAADGYHKEGRKTEALDLLRQTAALDPTNTTSRLKVADLLRQEGMESEALAEYEAVAEELENQQERDQLITVLERILELKPDHVGALTGLTRNLMTAGDLARAESFAVQALDASGEPAQYELLMELYSQAGNEARLAETTRALAKLHRDRGDEETARQLMQRLPVEEVGSSSRLAVDMSEVDEPDLGDEELLEEEPFLTLDDESGADSLSKDEGADELVLGGDDIEIELDVAGAEETPIAQPPPEGDPDQLLAEASVYLRYGKREQAIASLQGVLAQDPTHRAALEKLGEAHAALGQTNEAVDAWKRAALQAREAGDGPAVIDLKERIAEFDPASAEQIGSVAPAAGRATPEADEPAPEMDLDVEIELDLDGAIEEVAASETQSGMDLGMDEDEFEIELDDESLSFDPPAVRGASEGGDRGGEGSRPIETTTPGFEVDQTLDEAMSDGLSASGGADSEDDEDDVEFDFDVDEMTNPPTGAPAGESTTTAEKIAEELEEAEFYLAQDMFDEAEAILVRILEMVPNHPSAMLRMGELEAARGRAPEAPGIGADDVNTSQVAAEQTFSAETEDFEETARFEDDESEDGGEDQTETAPAEREAAEPAPATTPDPDGESFDLREALADVLVDDEEVPKDDGTSGVLSTVEDGFGSIFSDFKKGVTATLEEGDFETRYDLGIAYREMGLFEDAIGEFRVCLEFEERRFDSLCMMGLCARDLSRFDDAVNHFEQALALPEIPAERMAGVYFDLSLAQEGLGQRDRALASLKKVLELEAGFPGAAERLEMLEAGGEGSPALGEPGEVFESFDDLFDEESDEVGDEAVVEAVPAETLEPAEEVVGGAESAAGDPGASTSDDSQSSRKGGRKKISFV
ncbi:MAG TPA: tetratricopeptide repeat protein, partial [Deltaproteobacteria bacterium]|nr:tetratricopeptide repeat protein [Deltaproteobacteria bacterium]